MAHEDVIGAHEERFKSLFNRIDKLEIDSKEVVALAKQIEAFKEQIANAVRETRQHIEAGSKWRLAIVVSCIGLMGTFVGGIVRFSVMEYKVSKLQQDQQIIQGQIYNLNYEKGKAVGLAESAK